LHQAYHIGAWGRNPREPLAFSLSNPTKKKYISSYKEIIHYFRQGNNTLLLKRKGYIITKELLMGKAQSTNKKIQKNKTKEVNNLERFKTK